MVAGTLREASSHLATAFRNNLQPSPLHVSGSSQLLPATRALFKAFSNADLAPKRQRAITPKLLQGVHRLAGLEFPERRDTPAAIATDLAVLGLLFAMRSCENTTTSKPGKTKTVEMVGAIFLNNNKREIPHDHPGLSMAAHVTLLMMETRVLDERRNGPATQSFAQCKGQHP